MEKILIIYELVPENTKFYLVSVDGEVATKIKSCHKQFGNAECSNAELTDWLDGVLSEEFASYECDITKPFVLKGPVTVVHTGFLL